MVSEFHQSRIWMASPSMSPRSIATALMAQRENVDTFSGWRPTVLPMRRTLLQITLVMSWILRTRHCVPSWHLTIGICAKARLHCRYAT